MGHSLGWREPVQWLEGVILTLHARLVSWPLCKALSRPQSSPRGQCELTAPALWLGCSVIAVSSTSSALTAEVWLPVRWWPLPEYIYIYFLPEYILQSPLLQKVDSEWLITLGDQVHSPPTSFPFFLFSSLHPTLFSRGMNLGSAELQSLK